MKHFISFQVAESPFVFADIDAALRKASPLATIFPFEIQTQTVGRLPVQTGVCHVQGRVGERGTLLLTGFLLTVSIGVVARDGPCRSKLPLGSKFQALSLSLANIHVLAARPGGNVSARWIAGTERVKYRNSASFDLVFELGVKNSGIGIEARQVVIVSTNLIVGTFFRIKIRVTNTNGSALAADAIDTRMQLVKVRCFIAFTYASFESPAIVGIPDQIGSRTDMPTESFMLVIARA